LQHFATLCNTLQHFATLCNTLQHFATLYTTLQLYNTFYNRFLPNKQNLNNFFKTVKNTNCTNFLQHTTLQHFLLCKQTLPQLRQKQSNTLHQFTKPTHLYKTLQHITKTKLYTTSQDFAKLYTTLRRQKRCKKDFGTHIQNLTTLYKTLQDFAQLQKQLYNTSTPTKNIHNLTQHVHFTELSFSTTTRKDSENCYDT